MHYRNNIIVLLMMVVLLGCSSGQNVKTKPSERPSWVDDPGRMYPFEMYISAVGSGDTPEAARNNAINGVAQVFKLDIKSQEDIIENYFETGTDKDLNMKRSSNVTKQINVTTDQNLKNVVIDKTWYSPNDARHYALAYIDRDQSSEIYLKDIKKYDDEVTAYFDKLKNSDVSVSKLTRLAYINEAMNEAASRDILIQQLLTLSRGEVSYTPKVSPSELIAARNEARQEIRVALRLEKSDWSEFDNAVRDVLQSFGFSIVQDNPDYIVTGGLSMRELEREGAFVRWQIDLHMSDAKTGTEFLTYSDEGREGHKTYSEAERRAARTAKEKVNSEFYKKIEEYLSSMIKAN
jgi:hypothetical protein